MRKTLWITAVLLLLIAGVFLARSMFSGFLYPAPTIVVGQPPAGYSEVSIESGSGSVVGWFHPGDTRRPAIVYFHGNGENLQTMKMSGLLDLLKGFGNPVLAVDYPGYGRSSGKASEPALVTAADAVAQWIVSRNQDVGWIAAGWSLGAAVAVQAAARNPEQLKGLIVLSGWSSLRETAANHYPEWMLNLGLKEQYDSAGTAPQIRQPVLAMHGELDTLIPVSLGEKLSRAFPDVRWIPLPDTEHNDLLGHPAVRSEIASFLRKFSEL